MTLYDFIKTTNKDYDTYDNVYDTEVTVCAFDDEDEMEEDYYEKFRIEIMKFVEVIKEVSDYELVCNWSDFIQRNINVFREYATEHWREEYQNLEDDDFIYEMIGEIHAYCAGALSDNSYKALVEEYMTRMV